MRKTLMACGLLLAVATTFSGPEPTYAKGNNAWVLTGGELGGYAMAGVFVNLIDLPAEDMVPAPATPPTPRYDLFDSYGIFAVPYQMWHGGGAWVHYYPTADLLEFQGADAANVPHTWYRPPPEIAATLHQAIDAALAERTAGRLEPNPIAADLRARHVGDVNYRLSPYPVGGLSQSDIDRLDAENMRDESVMQIHGDASDQFGMHALVDTLSHPPAGTTLEPPRYVITSWGSGLFGGLFGCYSPPVDGRGGRFWDGDYSYDKGTPYYATTSEFDGVVARALATGKSPAVAPSALAAGVVTAPPSPSRHGRAVLASIVAAAVFGLALLAARASVGIASRRRRPATTNDEPTPPLKRTIP